MATTTKPKRLSVGQTVLLKSAHHSKKHEPIEVTITDIFSKDGWTYIQYENSNGSKVWDTANHIERR